MSLENEEFDHWLFNLTYEDIEPFGMPMPDGS